MTKRTGIAARFRWLALTALAACGGQGSRETERINVVLICLDTVRADHLGTYGYARETTPALDALARRSRVFDDASACAGWTKPSVPSYLTGTYPCQHGVYEGSAHDTQGETTDVLPDSAVTLAEVFHQNGYRTGAFVHNAQLRAGNGFEQGFDLYSEANMDAQEIRWRGLDWLDQESGRPFFLYLHFLDAHWPYPAPEPWVSRFASLEETAPFRGPESKALFSAINDGEHALTEAERAALEGLYDGALAYLDSELASFFAGLERRGLTGRTIVCVVADHGEEFGEHGRIGHGHGLWENLLHVPWILHVPGTAPARVTAPVSLIDLFPTLLSAAGLAPPAACEGVDRLLQPDLERAILAEHKAPDRYFQSVRQDHRKLQRTFTAPRDSDVDALVVPIVAGTRWEAEFAVADGKLYASELKPRDEAADKLPELKGPVEDLSDDGFTIAGVRVVYDVKSTRQADPGIRTELQVGHVVKVRGPQAGGAMYAERIRFYAPGEDTQAEIRATVETVVRSERSCELTMGGFHVLVTPRTELKDVEGDFGERRLTREQISALLAGGPDYARSMELELARLCYDLELDPGELAPQDCAPHAALEQRLETLTKDLAGRRTFGTGDRRTLDDKARQELRDIGY